MEQVELISVSERLDNLWNIKVYDYNYDGKNCDLQDLLVAIANNRATKIEAEIKPQSTRMRTRNKMLENLGIALSDLSRAQGTFDTSATTDKDLDSGNALKKDTVTLLGSIGWGSSSTTPKKSQIDSAIQLVKTKMDALNNQAQTDMTRLQGLVDKRDESFTSSSTLMSGVSDTRTNLIKNIS